MPLQRDESALCLSPLECHFLVLKRKPSPDSDVISLIESIKDTMANSVPADLPSDITPCNSIVIRSSRSQNSHNVVLCSCDVGVRQPGIQLCTSEAVQQPTDFLSPGQREFTTLHMLAVLCLTGVGFGCNTAVILIGSQFILLFPCGSTMVCSVSWSQSLLVLLLKNS